jgi:hypothetical protein
MAKTGNVDQGKDPVSPEISKRNKEVIFDHKTNGVCPNFQPLCQSPNWL